MASSWTREAVARITDGPIPTAPLIDRALILPILPGFDLWDYWPIQEQDGCTAVIAGGTLHMLLSAPVTGDPDERHGIARIRFMHQTEAGWNDLGNLLPNGFSPGSREWSGSAVIDDCHNLVTLYFTAAGRRSEHVPSFDQRLFETQAPFAIIGDLPCFGEWSDPVELVVPDGKIYASDMSGGGALGTIKAFRDPAWFRDPADAQDYLLFAASLAGSESLWNGAVGVARRESGRWVLADPLIEADGVNNELERPHVIWHVGRYYCFWSTQAKVFATRGPRGPTGLYGMVAEQMNGPWHPLNGSGLVFANPANSPMQAFSWLVLADLSVISFVDRPGLSVEPDNPMVARRHFGGTPAPTLRLELRQDRAWLA